MPSSTPGCETTPNGSPPPVNSHCLGLSQDSHALQTVWPCAWAVALDYGGFRLPPLVRLVSVANAHYSNCTSRTRLSGHRVSAGSVESARDGAGMLKMRQKWGAGCGGTEEAPRMGRGPPAWGAAGQWIINVARRSYQYGCLVATSRANFSRHLQESFVSCGRPETR